MRKKIKEFKIEDFRKAYNCDVPSVEEIKSRIDFSKKPFKESKQKIKRSSKKKEK